MEPTWKRIVGFPMYSVSDHGHIRKDSSGRILALSENQYGVVCVGLMRNQKQYHRSVPLLVAEAFLPRLSEAFDTPINMDGDRRNNRVANLAWRPRWFAVHYNRQFTVEYEHRIYQTIVEVGSRVTFEDSLSCATCFGLLERDLVLSILNRTVVWPSYQEFQVLEE